MRCILAVGAGFIARTSAASSVTVPDFSFEKTVLADGANGGALNVGTNWSAAGVIGAINGGVYLLNSTDATFDGSSGDATPLPAPADGLNALFMSLVSSKGYAWQNIGALQADTKYTLTVAVGQSLTGDTGVGKIALINGTDPLGTLLTATNVDSSTLTAGSFADSSVVLTTGHNVSGPLTILLQGDSGTQLIFDNVRLDATAAAAAPTALAIKASPTNTVYAGTSSVTLSEDAAGDLPLSYQWQSDNGSGGATFNNISGATSASYVVNTSAFTPNSPVQYRVVVSNSSGSSTSESIPVTVITGPPVVIVDTTPSSGSDVVGSSVTFSAAFAGSLPISYQWLRDGNPIAGATNTSLTITNLQLSDSGAYNLRASNGLGIVPVTSAPSQFTVNPAPVPADGIITSVATQSGLGGDASFSPTWTVPSNDLIAGTLPSDLGAGDFSGDGWGNIAVLTDRKAGQISAPGSGSPDFVTAGIPPYGSTITYTLTGSAIGYDLTSLVVFGGWGDGSHDQQKFIVFYSTVASPTTFNQLTGVDFNPDAPAVGQSATRVTITSANGVIAKNVAAVKLEFNSLQPPTVEGGYAGYSEIAITGVPSAPAPVLAANISPLGGSDVEGSSVTFTASFTSQTPITYQWRVDNGSGLVNIPNATNATLTLSNLQLSDSGSYSVQASNASGSTVTSSSVFTVNPAPIPDDNGVIVSQAGQYGASPFKTTWTIGQNNLVANLLPSGLRNGNFSLEGGGGVKVLTDGTFGYVGLSGGGNNSTRATAGNGGGSGDLVTYTLPTGPSGGYTISNIVVYAGWNDGGRDQQAYTVYYSTVDSPDNFIPLTSVDFNPTVPASTPTADRITISSATGGALAVNVARVQFDFSTPSTENGYAGYAEIGVYGSPSPAITFAPFLSQDTLPITGSDIVGSEVTFTAKASGNPAVTYQWRKDTGSGPIDIAGATSATLTLTNLQLGDTANYSVRVENSLGAVESVPNSFTVNPTPDPVNNIITAIATQTGAGVGSVFSPTWTIKPSLISGAAPSAVGSGNFNLDSSGGVGVLTDGKFGVLNPPGVGSLDLATTGPNGGKSVTYQLTGAASGYDLSAIVVYGGWSDGGRDQQSYAVSYATASDPATFVPLTSVSYNPTLPGTVQSATRSTLTSSTAAPLASGVVAIRFDFAQPVENNYAGYAEIGVFGKSSARLNIDSTHASNGNLTLVGSGGAANGSFTVVSSTDITAPINTWETKASGAFDASGSFSIAIPITTSEKTRFFKIKYP